MVNTWPWFNSVGHKTKLKEIREKGTSEGRCLTGREERQEKVGGEGNQNTLYTGLKLA